MSLNAKLLLPVALGVSLVSVTAFVVYYVFKKDEEETGTNGSKSIKTSRVNVIEINVPKSIVPALIGKSCKIPIGMKNYEHYFFHTL